jgi:DNA invertase Pin-like site-specific DNA recombinase
VRLGRIARRETVVGDQLTVVGYCRTSGEGQRDNTSIPTQKADVTKYAITNGWKVVAR